ncbi:MAG: CcmD family protein [Bacteroidetes bacterium]|nr:CcmD family protein [Bacteroidota bacterium]
MGSCTIALAQNNNSGTDELMRSNGKIYVVVAVCLTILIGLFGYVFFVDRKISKIEKK